MLLCFAALVGGIICFLGASADNFSRFSIDSISGNHVVGAGIFLIGLVLFSGAPTVKRPGRRTLTPARCHGSYDSIGSMAARVYCQRRLSSLMPKRSRSRNRALSLIGRGFRGRFQVPGFRISEFARFSVRTLNTFRGCGWEWDVLIYAAAVPITIRDLAGRGTIAFLKKTEPIF